MGRRDGGKGEEREVEKESGKKERTINIGAILRIYNHASDE